MEKQNPNPCQGEALISLGRKIRKHLASGETRFNPETYKSIREKARLVWPFKNEVVAALCAAVKSGTLTIVEAKALVIHIFSKREKDAFRQLELSDVELGVMLDLEFEKLFQADRRAFYDPRLAEAFDDSLRPEVLEAEKNELPEEEAYWLRVLADMNSDSHSILDTVITSRSEVDELEADKERITNEIAGINVLIRDLKSKARKARDEEVIAIAKEIHELNSRRGELRQKVQQIDLGLSRISYNWLLSTEQKLENEADQAITALKAITTRASEINELLANPPTETDVPEVDELDIIAEAYSNVAHRVHERIPGLPRYKREFLEALARRLEEEAIILEV